MCCSTYNLLGRTSSYEAVLIPACSNQFSVEVSLARTVGVSDAGKHAARAIPCSTVRWGIGQLTAAVRDHLAFACVFAHPIAAGLCASRLVAHMPGLQLCEACLNS